MAYRCELCDREFAKPAHLANHSKSCKIWEDRDSSSDDQALEQQQEAPHVDQQEDTEQQQAHRSSEAYSLPDLPLYELDEHDTFSDQDQDADIGFDSSFELFTVLRQWAKGQGSSASDIQKLLELLHNQSFTVSEVPRKAADLQRYGKQLLSQLAPDEEAGWDKVKLDIKHWPDQVKLRKRDGVKYIQQVLARADILDGLHLEGQPRFTSSGDLTYCEVWESDAFLQAQEAVRQQHGRDAKVLGLQFYSDKTLVNNKTEVYAFKIGLLNLDLPTKVRHLGTLALIPILKPREDVSSSNLRAARRQLMAVCIKDILSTLREASKSGLDIKLADGSRHQLFPRPLSWVADDPEQHAVLQIKAGKHSMRQCVRCFCLTQDLAAVDIVSQSRTLSMQRRIFNSIQQAKEAKRQAKRQRTGQPETPLRSANEISRLFGTHPDECGLWGFDGEECDACDPYQIFGYDFLHNWPLGVLQLVIGGISSYADRVGHPGSRHHGTKALKVLDQRLRLVPRVEGLTLPSTRQYFSDPANITGKEHLAVQQVLPLLVHNLVDNHLTNLVCLACDLAMRMYGRNRPSGFTQQDLVQLDAAIIKFRDTMQRVYGRGSCDTPKFHKLSHVTSDIKRVGHLRNINSDMYEATHALLKEIYRLTSRRVRDGQFLDEIVQGLQLRQMLDRLDGLTGSRQGRQYATAYMSAAASSSHQLSRTFDTVDLQIVQRGEAGNIGRLNRQLVTRSLDLWEADVRQGGALGLLAVRLQEYSLSDVGGLVGTAYRQHIARFGLPPLHSPIIRVHTSAVLAADPSWDVEDSESELLLQTVRATSAFHGAPWYDRVAVRIMESDAGADAVEYAELVLLLQAQLRNPLVSTAMAEWTSLAYVKWFKRQGARGDMLARYGAVPLAWDIQPDGQHRYGVIPLSSIVRREHIVPGFEDGTAELSGVFYVNPFKY